MKLATKLGLGMSSLVGFLVILGIFSLYQMAAINQASIIITHLGMPAIIAADEMDISTSNYRMKQLQHIMSTTSEEMDRFGKEMDAERKRFEDASKAYSSFGHGRGRQGPLRLRHAPVE